MRTRQWLVTIAVLLLAGCQSAMSVDEAKKVATSFEKVPLAPPPAKQVNPGEVLSSQTPDPGVTSERLAQIEAAPPNADHDTLAKFYLDRGRANLEHGRGGIGVQDLRRALSEDEQGAKRSRYPIILWLSIAEWAIGNAERAIEILKRAIAELPFEHGFQISFNSRLACFYAEWGDLPAAERHLATAKRVGAASARWQVTGTVRALWAGQLGEGEGKVLEAKGQYAMAESAYRKGISALVIDPTTANGYYLGTMRSNLAIALLRQGRLLEAESEAREAVNQVLRFRGAGWTPPLEFITLALVLTEQGRFTEALALNERRIIPGYPAVSARAVQLKASILVAQGRWQEASTTFASLAAGVNFEDPERYRRLYALNADRGIALVKVGKSQDGLDVLTETLAQDERILGPGHSRTAETRALRAVALMSLGDRAGALSEFATAMPVLLKSSFEAVEDQAIGRPARDQRLRLIATSYLELLAAIKGTPLESQHGLDAAAEAFRVADVTRDRSVQRALDQSAGRAAASDRALAALVRQEQDTKKQIAALAGSIAAALSAPGARLDAKNVVALRSEIEQLTRARATLAASIQKQFPSYAQLVNPEPTTVDKVRAMLASDEALITTYVAEDRTYVWAVAPGTPVEFASVPLGRNEIEEMVGKLRTALAPAARVVGDIPAFDVAVSNQLYSALLAPVAGAWRGAANLLVVPDGALAQLPFAVLVTAPAALGSETPPLFTNYRTVPWLGRSHALTTLPSVSALATLRRAAPAPARLPFIGFGDPFFSAEQASAARAETSRASAATVRTRGADIVLRDLVVEGSGGRLAALPRLPDTRDEIRSIAEVLGATAERDVFLGERANEKNVKEGLLDAYRVIVFATHGLVAGDLEGLTQPALALTAPEVAGVAGDGLLTMDEVLALRLNADWVVLSACNTASGNGAGSEAISGLGRAFFYAGARALLVSNWPVETTSARTLTTELFRRQHADPTLPRAKALQQTMTWLIEQGVVVNPATRQAVFSYAHPIFWAPFTLVGDGGGPR